MSKFFLSVSVFILLFLGNSNSSDSNCYKKGDLKKPNFFLQVDRAEHFSKADTSEIPEEIKFPSTVGGVLFPHQMHIDDLEIECVECHHQINAKILVTPHSDYFKSSWI